MGIINNWLTKALNKQVNDLFKTNMVFMGGTSAVYADSELTKLIDIAFNENIHYYSIIRKITKKFASPPRFVYTKGGKDTVENDLSKLLAQGGDQLWEAIYGYKVISGEAFIRKNRGGIETGRPLELEVIPSQIVELVPDPEDINGVTGYNIDLGGSKLFVPKEDMIHWKSFNPNFDAQARTHLRGFNPLGPQQRTLTASNEAIDAQVSMMQNGGAKGVLTNESLGSLTQEQESQLRSVINNKINNSKVKAAVAALQGKWSYLNIGSNSVDMQLLDTDEHTIKALCNANGIPYELFQSDTTFANKEQALVFYITNELMPDAASLDSILTKNLAEDFGGGFEIKTDFSELPEMATLNAKLVDAALKAWWKSPNEKRVMTNDEPIESPAMNKVYIPSGYTPIDDVAEPILPEIADDTVKKLGLDYYQ